MTQVKHIILPTVAGLLAIADTASAQWSYKETNPKPEGYLQKFTAAEWDASNFATKKDLKWFEDAKYGMFLCFGLSTHNNVDLSWGVCYDRKAPDVGHGPLPASVWTKWADDFKIEKFDAKKIIANAKRDGFKYIVIVVKHHDGFHLWNTKFSDFNVMHTPYGKDYLKELADACHEADLPLGIYYSQRDWYHPDYMPVDTNKVTMKGINWTLKPGETTEMGDCHKKYIDYQFKVCRELCTKYGKVDIFWFDAYYSNGMFTPDMWESEKLTRMIRELQPGIVINNRASIPGDYDTPEQTLGSFQDWRPWESAMTLSSTWSYSGTPVQPLDNIVYMIVSNACGGGNVLLSWGPKWDGEFEANESKRLQEVGVWLQANGESIYGTRCGPWKKSAWGGSTHRGDKCYLHILNDPGKELKLPSLPGRKVRSVKLLHGKSLPFNEAEAAITISIPEGVVAKPDTIVELTMDGSVDGVKSMDVGRFTIFNDEVTYGKIVSRNAKVTTSSRSEADPGVPGALVMENAPSSFAFHTQETESKPWVEIDLGKVQSVTGVRVANRIDCCSERAKTLTMSVSEDGKNWQELWRADDVKPQWDIPVTDTVAGAQVPGRKVRYVRLQLDSEVPTPLHLRQVEIWAKPGK